MGVTCMKKLPILFCATLAIGLGIAVGANTFQKTPMLANAEEEVTPFDDGTFTYSATAGTATLLESDYPEGGSSSVLKLTDNAAAAVTLDFTKSNYKIADLIAIKFRVYAQATASGKYPEFRSQKTGWEFFGLSGTDFGGGGGGFSLSSVTNQWYTVSFRPTNTAGVTKLENWSHYAAAGDSTILGQVPITFRCSATTEVLFFDSVKVVTKANFLDNGEVYDEFSLSELTQTDFINVDINNNGNTNFNNSYAAKPENTTGSFIFKFGFETNTVSDQDNAGNMTFRIGATGAWGETGHFLHFDLNATRVQGGWMQLCESKNNVQVTSPATAVQLSGMFEANTMYSMELGCIKVAKDSNDYFWFVKKDGQFLLTTITAFLHDDALVNTARLYYANNAYKVTNVVVNSHFVDYKLRNNNSEWQNLYLAGEDTFPQDQTWFINKSGVASIKVNSTEITTANPFMKLNNGYLQLRIGTIYNEQTGGSGNPFVAGDVVTVSGLFYRYYQDNKTAHTIEISAIWNGSNWEPPTVNYEVDFNIGATTEQTSVYLTALENDVPYAADWSVAFFGTSANCVVFNGVNSTHATTLPFRKLTATAYHVAFNDKTDYKIDKLNDGDVMVLQGTWQYSDGKHLHKLTLANPVRLCWDETNEKWINATINDAEAYANLFMSTITCDNGLTPPSSQGWSDMSDAFDLLDNQVKIYLKNVVSDENGTTSPEKAMARYDYIITKYGDSLYADFIGRTVSQSRSISPLNNDNTAYITLAFVLVGMAFTAGFYLYLRKKKHQ